MFGNCKQCNELAELNEQELCQECMVVAQGREAAARGLEISAYFDQLIKGVEKSFNTIYQETGEIINLGYSNNELLLEVIEKLDQSEKEKAKAIRKNEISINMLWVGMAVLSIVGLALFAF
jgi:hypothetical protein